MTSLCNNRKQPFVGCSATRSILHHFDAEAVSVAAQRETRNREIHLPPISVYRWWARRTESVFGSLVLAAGTHLDRERLLIADPFAGGGVIPLVAVLHGHRVYAQDLNPWAALGLVAMLGLPEADAIEAAVTELATHARSLVNDAYATVLLSGEPASVAHTFRVAVANCSACGLRSRLFPHAVVTLLVRKERKNPEAFLACPRGHLFRGRIDRVSRCSSCKTLTNPEDKYTSGRIVDCWGCGHTESLANRASSGAWDWDVVLVERVGKKHREIDIPFEKELVQAEKPEWKASVELGDIPAGRETRVLLRHGFKRWEDIYPRRQRAVTEKLLDFCEEVVTDPAARGILRMAILGTTEMAGLLSRWDRWYLKSYESMAGHRFNFTTIPVEPNVWGVAGSGRGTVLRRLRLFVKAASWFESKVVKKLVVEGPLMADHPYKPLDEGIDARVVEGNSERMALLTGSVDVVLTDPPYHDDVQYDELSLPLRAWARLSTERLTNEAVARSTPKRESGKSDNCSLLSSIFREALRTLRSDGHLVLSYANREPEAWVDLFSALQEAGFRAVGFEVVHSENETDHAKRGVRACALDLIMDLVHGEIEILEQWKAKKAPVTREECFLSLVGETFSQVGELPSGWEEEFIAKLTQSEFLSSTLDVKQNVADSPG